ncbi:outer membrane protein assembly factor BamB family protein [Halostagnicola bangensis]
MMDGRSTQTRRRLLATCAGATAGVAGLAGCTADDENDDGENGDDGSGDGPGEFDEENAEYGVWPMAHYDAANTAVAPNSGPEGEPEEKWSVEVDSSPTVPVVANRTVFVGERGGKYHGIDLVDGETLWEHEPNEWGDLRGEENTIFTPAVSNTAVYVSGDGVEALEHSGEKLWTSDHDTLFNLRIYEETIYGRTDEYLYGIDEETGEEVLEIQASDEIETLAIDGERIIVATRKGDEDFLLEGYERSSGDNLWNQAINDVRGAEPDIRIVDGTIYTVKDMEVISIEIESGDVESLYDFSESNTRPAQPTVYDGRVYVPTELPEVPVLNSETGERVSEWENRRLKGRTSWRMPISSETLYVWTPGTVNSPGIINALNPETGEKNWEMESTLTGLPTGPIVLEDSLLYADNSDNTIVLYR